jgi:hypothetical protein
VAHWVAANFEEQLNGWSFRGLSNAKNDLYLNAVANDRPWMAGLGWLAREGVVTGCLLEATKSRPVKAHAVP